MENFTAVRTAVLGAIVLAVQAFAQGTQAKQSASQYYAHGELDKGNSLGADFLGKFLPIRGSTIYSDEYVFVEVALFGPSTQKRISSRISSRSRLMVIRCFRSLLEW